MHKVRMMGLSCAAAFALISFMLSCPNPTQGVVKSTNADLSALAISSGIFSPAFAAGTTTYYATVVSGVASITITATKADSDAKIELRVNGGSWAEISSGTPSPSLGLSEGANTVELRVTAEDGQTTKIYTISVYRLSAMALLSTLSTSSGTLTPAFDSNTVSYALSLANVVSDLTVTATVAQAGATIQVQVSGGAWLAVTSGSPSPSLSLNVGDNLVEVKVSAQDGFTSNTYTITAHRKSANADLSALVPSAGTLSPAFSSSTTSYTLAVGSAVSSITVTPTAAYSLSTIEVQVNGRGWLAATSGSPSPSLLLNVGDNTVVVRVTAEDGSPQKSYSITVHRPSGNVDLSTLTISSGTLNPAFSSSITSYTDTVLNAVSSVTVTPSVAQASATIQVQLNGGGWQACTSNSPSPSLSLNLGTNIVEVKVTAEDPSVTKTYMITVVRRYSGALDIDFATGAGANNFGVGSIVVQSNAKILIGGSFTTYNGTSRDRIARLNADGSLDASFAAMAGANIGVYSIALQSDGRILIGGPFTTYNGTSRGHIARLNSSDGSLDKSFLNTGAGANDSVHSVVVQSADKVLIGGHFTTYNGISRGYVARLNSSDGSLDNTFLTTGVGANGDVYSIALQSGGKILIGGNFTTYNGTSRGYVARLNSDGSLDTSFLATGAGADDIVNSIAVQSDGKILIGGFFTTYNGTSRGHIARLNSDSSLDAGFLATGSGAFQIVRAVALQSEGKILIGGEFIAYNDTSRNYVARLNSDGSLDNTFLGIEAGVDSMVLAIALQSDGKILIGGWFTIYKDQISNTNRGHVARLWGD
jgi:uncharacterized delta-60 repeat protein